jgi:hypothetical protein
MSIRSALDWIKSHGLAEKYNPYHHPKGSPLGGKFAPKSMAGGGAVMDGYLQ